MSQTEKLSERMRQVIGENAEDDSPLVSLVDLELLQWATEVEALEEEITGLHENQSDLYIKLGGEDETLSNAMQWHACAKLIGELRRDRERLDWLDKYARKEKTMTQITWDGSDATLRQAIDAAMQSEKAKNEGAHFAKVTK